jgi:hypothetical protein
MVTNKSMGKRTEIYAYLRKQIFVGKLEQLHLLVSSFLPKTP